MNQTIKGADGTIDDHWYADVGLTKRFTKQPSHGNTMG